MFDFNMWGTTPLSAFKAQELDLPPDLIEGLLPSQALVTLAGEPGLGKSFTGLSWAAAIALGAPWLGLKTGDPKRVVYVLGEGYARFSKRVRAWEEAHEQQLPEWLEFIDGARAGIDLTKPEHIQTAIDTLSWMNTANGWAWCPPALIIFDTFSMLARIESENDNSQVAKVFANAQRLVRSLNTTVVIVHHVSKEGGKVRGATAFRGNVDTVIVAKRQDKDSQGRNQDDDPNPEFMLSTHIEHDGKQRDEIPVLIKGLYVTSPGVLTSVKAENDKMAQAETQAVIARDHKDKAAAKPSDDVADALAEYMAVQGDVAAAIAENQIELETDAATADVESPEDESQPVESSDVLPGQSELPFDDNELQMSKEDVTV